ncbi:iojap-like protein [Candidatus Vecturithrix granuli]|uniref:Ribosomal silencing factor RsfS n=1 Tax=Vecturithrix granuli TaxID=1499967 RepID=A0A081C7W9_VECG1|nr:iojap-like protein [Candidatus Vecturithrix granuli]
MITVTKDEAVAVARVALDKKAQDVLLLEISALVSYADYFLICSGRSSVQVKAIAEAIERNLRERGIRPLHVEGATEGRWILMDYDELIVHVFLEETRQFYNLERLWNDAPRIAFEDGKSQDIL